MVLPRLKARKDIEIGKEKAGLLSGPSAGHVYWGLSKHSDFFMR